MADDRTTLKAFFETEDKPTQAQFAALIDGLLSLVDDSNLANGIKIKSETNGEIEIIVSDSFFQITTDGGNFLESFIFFDPTFLSIGFENTFIQFDSVTGIKVIADGILFYNVSVAGITVISINRVAALTHFKLILPTFADNVAALAGGLITNDIYKTATGALRITI